MKTDVKKNNKKIEKEIEKLIGKLTLDEKISMIHGTGIFRTGEVERLGIPGVVSSDGPMGVRAEFMRDRWIPAGNHDDNVSYLPSNSALASTWNPYRAYEMGHVLGAEARGRGKDVILAPGINIKRSPLCGRNFEYMSEDPKLTATLAVPFIKGVQENDVAACVKHFAANVQETDRLMVDEEIDDRTLYEIYFPAFKAAVQEGGSYSIMGAYNVLNGA
ncbi:MAG: glycosyl hydrolase, partial [Lachnospiraceae bacterium]|nr:glycosyl hydrolase [Lachnospiraceae bacterium]